MFYSAEVPAVREHLRFRIEGESKLNRGKREQYEDSLSRMLPYVFSFHSRRYRHIFLFYRYQSIVNIHGLTEREKTSGADGEREKYSHPLSESFSRTFLLFRFSIQEEIDIFFYFNEIPAYKQFSWDREGERDRERKRNIKALFSSVSLAFFFVFSILKETFTF